MIRTVLSLLAACLLAGSPLAAQLDPRLQGSPTDFLDLYQGITKPGVVRPEVLLVMDFGYAGNAMMFHRLFPNNLSDEELYNANSTRANIYVKIQQDNRTLKYSIQQVAFGGDTYSGNLRTEVQASGRTYTIGGYRVESSGSMPAYNTLIKPDGTEVTEDDVRQTLKDARVYRSSETVPQAFVSNWVRCASHVRMRCTYGGVTRTIDFPINWAVLGPTSKGAPLSRTTVRNPHDHQSYEIDTLFQSGQNGADYEPLREVNGQVAEIGSKVSKCYLYRTRYIEWAFWGKTGDAYFVPDAIDPKLAVDPDSIAFDGESQTCRFSTAIVRGQAFRNGLPNLNRIQAIKQAFLSTWFTYQDRVSFAYRTLYGRAGIAEASGDVITPYVFDTNQWGLLDPDDPSTWTVIASQSANSVEGRPLLPTHFDALCQMSSASAFANAEKNLKKADLECLKHFLILIAGGGSHYTAFGDGFFVGQPIDGTFVFPYLSSTGSQSTYAGNLAVQRYISRLDQGNLYWNNVTLAAVAAHGGQAHDSSNPKDWVRDPRQNLPGESREPQDWAPFWIRKRSFGGQVFDLDTPHPIQTMTVGVGLGSHYQTADGEPWPQNQMIHDTSSAIPIFEDPTGKKYRLLMTALSGDPAVTDLSASSAKPYYGRAMADTQELDKASDATYFFDAQDPGLVVNQLDQALRDIVVMSGVSCTTAPVVPYVGLGMGRQIYITRFEPPSDATTPPWIGDLAMFPTRIQGESIQVMDSEGSAITGGLEKATPRWSAEDALRRSRPWSQRQVWTRLTGKAELCRFTPFDDGTGGAPGGAFSLLKGSIAKALAKDADKQQLIAWNLGASLANAATGLDPLSPNRPLPGGQTSIVPPGDLLGDIIDSTPTTVEYSLTDALINRLPPKLRTQYEAAPSGSAHFRVVFVGTNRGFLHAFGEITYTKVSGSGTRVVDGEADELWAFMPTDFLANLDTIGPTAKALHRFGVNGIPFGWFHDKPAAGSVLGNGRVDPGEKAVVVFGLGKGGRSYYGLNIEDPFIPRFGWALVPDEAGSLSSNCLDADGLVGQNGLGTVQSVVAHMGFSSCMPATGRVLMGITPKVRDVLFLGGGYAPPEVEANFGTGFAMGRSALALDILTGKILAAWDFTGSGMGPVASGLVPFAFFPNSGLVQRAYFTDYKGGLWALGSGRTNTDGLFRGFRRDSSALDAWTVDGTRGSPVGLRHVYQGSSSTDHVWRDTTGPQNAIHSMRPAPFLVPSFPGLASLSTSTAQQMTFSPSAVGVAVVSGDRENPLDHNYTATSLPTRHRLTVIWDRQDSARSELAVPSGGITTTRLLNLTSALAPVSADSWNDHGAATNLGYYMDFPAPGSQGTAPGFVPKGIYEPAVLDGALFFSYFWPSSSSCAGGSGKTFTTRICDVLFPASTASGADPQGPCWSGVVAAWAGITSPFAALSASTILQGGSPMLDSGSISGLKIKAFQGGTGERSPRIRIWRSVR